MIITSRTFLYAFVAILNLATAFYWPNLLSSFVSTILYTILAVIIFRMRPVAFLIFSPIIFLHFTVLISLNAIESGAYMKEMGQAGYESASSAFYLLVVSIFLVTALAVFSRLDRAQYAIYRRIQPKNYYFITHWAASLFCVLAILLLFAKGFVTGFPLLEGFDRFAYRRVAGDPITLNLLNLKIVVACFLGVSAASCVDSISKTRHHVLFLFYIFASFLFGDKFFIIISSALCYIGTQVVFDASVVKERMKRLLPALVLAISLAISVTIYIYSGLGTYSLEKTAGLLLGRFAGQGQLWFVSFNNVQDLFLFDSQSVMLNLNSLMENPAQDYVFEKRIGPFHFVQKYSPVQMYWSFIGNAGFVAPIMVFEAYLLELFGFIGLFPLVILAGAGLGIIAYLITAATKSGNPFNVLLPSYVFVQYYYLIVSGTIYNVFGIGTYKAYAAFFVLQIIVSYWIMKTRKLKVYLPFQNASVSK